MPPLRPRLRSGGGASKQFFFPRISNLSNLGKRRLTIAEAILVLVVVVVVVVVPSCEAWAWKYDAVEVGVRGSHGDVVVQEAWLFARARRGGRR